MAQKPKRAVSDEIDRNLKRAFDEVVNEPLPERFSTLLEKLRTQSRNPPSDTEEGDD